MSTGSTYDESILLSQIAEGNEAAFRKIFDLYKDRFYGVAHKMTGSDYVTEEIVQETFVALWKHRLSVADVKKPSSYLFSIFYRSLYQYFKREAKAKQKIKAITQHGPLEDEGFEEKFIIEDQYELLERAISALPPQQAMVYKLSKIEGLSREEVADKMGISPNTVRNHLADAITALKKFVRRAGILLIMANEYFRN